MAATLTLVPDFLAQMFSYREYLKQSVLRDLRTKYKRSLLGYLWTVFHPLAMMVVLSIVFSHIMKIAIKDYAVFLFAGLLPWNYFSSTAMMSIGSIRNNARLFGLLPVPKYIFIISISFSNLVNFILSLIPLVLIMLVAGRTPSLSVLFFPLALLPLFCVVIGISLVLAASNVFFDDTLHLTEVALSALYFLSPVLYYRDLLPPDLVKYLVWNPLFIQIETFRKIFYEGVFPDMETYALNLGGSVLILMLGLWIFRRVEDKFLYFV
ncbi:MAG: ABC transporter permease [Bdellovibrionota bacterium]